MVRHREIVWAEVGKPRGGGAAGLASKNTWGRARTDCLSIEDGMYVGSSAWGVGDSLNQTELDGREMWRVELLLIGPSRG